MRQPRQTAPNEPSTHSEAQSHRGKVGPVLERSGITGSGPVLHDHSEAGQQEHPGHAVGQYDLQAYGSVMYKDEKQCHGDRDREAAESTGVSERTKERQQQDHKKRYSQPQDRDDIPESDEPRRSESEDAWT